MDGMNPADAWTAAIGQLELQLHKTTFNTWLRPTEFLSYTDGVFTISVNSGYAKDWLEQRFYRKLQATLSSIFGQKVDLEFEVHNVNPEVRRFVPPHQLLPIEQLIAKTTFTGTPNTNRKEKKAPQTTEFTTAKAISSSEDDFQPTARAEHLNENYTFETFITSRCNQLAYAAAKAVAKTPGMQGYSPLVIHSGVGVGKTHLIQAIGNALRKSGHQVLYVGAETFTNDLVKAIRTKKTEAFRNYYRNVDVLVIDDMQFIQGKESTQEEFFHTFNWLHNQNKQIIVGLNCAPNELTTMDARIRSRLEGGLAMGIDAPDFDMRYKMILQKADIQDVNVPDDVARAIAHKYTASIRELEGATNQIFIKAALARQPITMKNLQDTVTEQATTQPLGIRDVIEKTAVYHQMTLDDLLSKQRSRRIAQVRHIAIYLAREELKVSLPMIGRAIGGRSHSTVLNSYKYVEEKLATDPAFRSQVDDVRRNLYQ